MVTKEDVFRLLSELGITKEDTVTVHTSLRAIGEIEGGADGLIDAFCEYLSDGLFIVPTHTWDTVTPEHPVFDVRTEKPCIGTLPTVAAFRKDAIRSLHPTHSVAVFGKNAAEFVKGEETSATPTPIDGSLARLYDMNAKVLLLGVGHEKNTYLHTIDERLDIPNRLNKEKFVITVRDYDGNETVTPPYSSHLVEGLNDCISNYFPYFKETFEDVGAVIYSQLGNALVYCCDCRKMTDRVTQIWEESGHTFKLEEQKI